MSKIRSIKGKRGTTYRVELMRQGLRTSKTFKLKKDAKEFLARMTLDDALSQTLTNRILNTRTLSDVVTEYLRQDTGKDLSKSQRLGYWVDCFGSRKLINITRPMVREELQRLSDNGKAPSTVNKFKSALSSVFKYLTERYDTEHNPVKGIATRKENNKRTRFLSEAETVALIEAVKRSKWDRLYLLTILALTTGARRSELIKLRWEQIDFKGKVIPLATTKNGEPRLLNILSNVLPELLKFRQLSGYVFPRNDVGAHYFKNFDCHWQAALKDARISDFRFHDLRHSCASQLAKGGRTILEIATVLGHENIATTKRYAHLCNSKTAEIMEETFGSISI